MKPKSGGLKKKRGRNAEKNHLNHSNSAIGGGGTTVQLGLFPAGRHPSNHQPAAAGVAAKSNLGVEIMAVAGVALALAGVVFLLVCCLVAGSRGDEDE